MEIAGERNLPEERRAWGRGWNHVSKLEVKKIREISGSVYLYMRSKNPNLWYLGAVTDHRFDLRFVELGNFTSLKFHLRKLGLNGSSGNGTFTYSVIHAL
ncbi:hypothetical protein HAX54_051861 [Datura stramonium]|uniref:Uncharacterized protein n=1 Tax=Datura stramonium TaxID=4076 RepID=A0ABS8SZ41_DATST|nr:hypothetical protein [Datura stramonium]